jgi:chromosome segregation protein
MRLDSIELIGFKSFADKTVFSFHPGMTAIVGPNGCGKSNVVDAFKWVLGEQSAKSLRGDSMEDVIFFGSAAKKTKGMAEVTLILSDVNGGAPGGTESVNESAGSQISVTRRLFRSGESEYLMNKVPCRLKDIKNMFLDTGLEIKAYSILEQGKMNYILNSKPQDRRFLIEEVAGVMKYKVRKAEALQKLDSSKSNLQRLQDIITEVKRQITSIDRHAKKAERYKKLFEEIKDIDVRIAKRDVNNLLSEVSGLSSSENELKSKEAELSSGLHSLESLIEEKKRACVEREKGVEELRVRLYQSEKIVTEGEGNIALLKQDCENLRGRIKDLQSRDEELSLSNEKSLSQINKLEDDKAEIDNRLLTLSGTLEEKGRLFSEMTEEAAGLEDGLETEKRHIFNKAEEASILNNEIKHLSEIINSLSQKTEKSSEDINTVKNDLATLQSSISESRNEYQRSESELSSQIKAKGEAVEALSRKRDELALSEEQLYKDREELAAMNSKLDSLQELNAVQKSAIDESIKTLCQIADVFETPPEYETAIEAVLGDKLNASVVGGREEITSAMKRIKEQNTKRSGFISVGHAEDALLGRDMADDYGSSEGVIGKAVDFVRSKSGFERIASALLNDVLLVKDLSAAFNLWERRLSEKSLKPSYLVTLDGEVLEPSGMVFGGVEKGVLKVKRQIKELSKDISHKKDQIGKNENMVTALRDDTKNIEHNIRGIEGDITEKEKYCHEIKVRIGNIDAEIARHNKKLEYLTIEMDDEEKEKENLRSLISEKRANSGRLDAEKHEAEEKIKALQDTIKDKKAFIEESRAELTEIKLLIAALNEKTVSFQKERERLNSVMLEIEAKKRDLSGERLGFENEITAKEIEIMDKEESLKSNILLISVLRSDLAKTSEILDAMNSELSFMEEKQKATFASLETLRKELNKVEMKNMESSMKLSYIKEDIRKTYFIDIETADVNAEITEEEEGRLPELKEKLQAIGPVSLGTLEEFEELKTRHDFLSKQQDDLLNAISSLEETIRKINTSTKQMLIDAFNALNEKFKEVFTTLFGKGKAELILTEGDILESGIEIVAQPPGKKLKTLSLLSGGEQALTALSLLFAGFMVKPTPMCLLDEVDAPLDESNTERFSKMLSEMSKKIQFITITHNRRTMEAADYIYGITMEDPGVSNVVSMHLAEA